MGDEQLPQWEAKVLERRGPALTSEQLEERDLKAAEYPWLPVVLENPKAKANLHRAIVYLRLESGEHLSLRDVAAILKTSLGNVHGQLELHPYGRPCEICKRAYLRFEARPQGNSGQVPRVSEPEIPPQG